MESLLDEVVRMGEIAAMMFDKDQGLFVFATTHWTKCCKTSGGATTPWTSQYEAPAPINPRDLKITGSDLALD